jgi:hypothetical protein
VSPARYYMIRLQLAERVRWNTEHRQLGVCPSPRQVCPARYACVGPYTSPRDRRWPDMEDEPGQLRRKI